MTDEARHDLVDRTQKSPIRSNENVLSWPGAASSLKVPGTPPFSRRPSPRVEDAMRSPRKAQRTRQRLTDHQTFDDAVQLLKDCGNIVVLTGAGISTSVGIPDFRSDKGLYNKLSKIGITQPEEFFSMSYFQENAEDFFKYVREVVPTAVPAPDGSYKPVKQSPRVQDGKASAVEVPKFTPTHAFLALLQSKNKLLTNYTQNIDGLERAAGLPSTQFIQCHGSWDSATCLTCGKSHAARKYLPVVHAGNVPYCKCFNEVPVQQKQSRRKSKKVTTGKKRKRADSFSDHSSDDGTKPLEPPRGLLKPDLVFFEEKITPLYHSRLESDRPRIDLLIIIGTSLKVAPIQYMLFKVRPNVPQIYISKERFSGALCSLPGVQVDIELLGECDLIIEELCRRAGWASHLEDLCWKEGQPRVRQISSYDRPAPHTQSIEPLAFSSSAPKVMQSKGTFDQTHSNRKPHADGSGKTGFKMEDSSDTTDTHYPSSKKSVTTDARAAVSLTNDAAPPSLSKEEPSKVKIELVEGTEHQWRITRKR